MGKEVIPEVVTHHCDRCKKELKEDQFDCRGSVKLIGRDAFGCAACHTNASVELCRDCTADFRTFIENRSFVLKAE